MKLECPHCQELINPYDLKDIEKTRLPDLGESDSFPINCPKCGEFFWLFVTGTLEWVWGVGINGQ